MGMIIVYTVCRDEKEAERIGKRLVDEELAACTNRWPIRSCYSWKGKTEESSEVAMIVKTKEDLVPEVFDRIIELNSYEVPALFSLPIHTVSEKYLDWLVEATGGEEHGDM